MHRCAVTLAHLVPLEIQPFAFPTSSSSTMTPAPPRPLQLPFEIQEILQGDEELDNEGEIVQEQEDAIDAVELDATLNADDTLDLNIKSTGDALKKLKPPPAKRSKLDSLQLEKHLELASQDVVVPGTRQEYERYVRVLSIQFNIKFCIFLRLYKGFLKFLVSLGQYTSSDDAEEAFKAKLRPAILPTFIALWIMDK